jgi:starch phosphorylase
MRRINNFSGTDGWWVEGNVEHVTGWSIGDDPASPADYSDDSAPLYDKLERVILPLY